MLAEHYLKFASVGALCVEVDGPVEMFATVGVKAPAGGFVFCYTAAYPARIAECPIMPPT